MSELLNADVVVSYGSHGIVELENGQYLDCKYRRQVGRPFCGDQVRIRHTESDAGVVEAILPRRNHFVRADAQQRQHIIAANLDQALVVISPRPAPSTDLVERYLLAVHSLNIEPVLVVNKAEFLLAPAERAVDTEEAPAFRHLDSYRAMGYQVIETSCKGAPGVATLAAQLPAKTSILVGQSGVGKSSLVRQLLPDLDIQTGALSSVTGKGTHTTTATTRYRLPDGGFLIDSPGVWEYGLWKLENRDLVLGFTEFRPWLDQCRFNDCLHVSEPACAIKQAVQDGHIESWRYEAYLRLLTQNIDHG